MGKASNRKRAGRMQASGEFGPDLAELAAALGIGIADERDAPRAAALLQAARSAVARAVPATFTHEGQRYWLRIAIAVAHLEVFDDPASATPLTRTVCGSSERYGHSPCH